MLPSSSENGLPTSRTIYVNPNFNRTTQLQQGHCVQPSIHINPNFLQKLKEQQARTQEVPEIQKQEKQQENILEQSQQIQIANALPTSASVSCKIISKSRMTLVRESKVPQMRPLPTPEIVQAPLISLNKRKLVRRTVAPMTSVSKPTATATAVIGISKPTSKSKDIVLAKYKIDRRCRLQSLSLTKPLVKVRRRRDFIGRYALRRATEHVINKKCTPTTTATTALKFKCTSATLNKTLQLLNINGVLYKSTPNKLQRKVSTSNSQQSYKEPSKATAVCTTSPTKSLTGRTIFVRGTKFVLDPKGFKLTRLPGHNAITRLPKHTTSNHQFQRRIDFGGLTYVASAKTQNVFLRTSNHVARAHLISAKQRSLQLLNLKLVKSNVPCAIFQRLGKCAAFNRGKCRKLHEKRQVIICSSFLRSECHNPNCLLSHNVSLAKMPVCKFFLQGMCVRTDCPYLHKKLSQNAEICIDFLRGFCPLAEQCNKRHEFLCPEYERHGKCVLKNCVYCKQMRRQHKRIEEQSTKTQIPSTDVAATAEATPTNKENEAVTIQRYFDGNIKPGDVASHERNADSDLDSETDTDECDDAVEVSTGKHRPKLGQLPAYIPLN